MFNLEQAAQLLIKAKLLDIKGYYEKTHSLRKLLLELREVWRKKEITKSKFIEENKKQLREIMELVMERIKVFENYLEYGKKIKELLEKHLSSFELFIFGSVVKGNFPLV